MKDKVKFINYVVIVAMFVSLAHITYRLHEIKKEVNKLEQTGCPAQK